MLVEGYFDAILLHQSGLTNAVALCSASLTAEQVKLLRRFECQEIVLILDGDDAGRRGVTRAAAALLATAMPTRVVVLPTGEDPDDHVLKVGGDAFSAELATALPLTEHLIQSAPPRACRAPSFEAPRSRGWPSSGRSWPRARRAWSAPSSSASARRAAWASPRLP